MVFEVSAVRAMYPALADGYAYLDGAAGTQVPVQVIDAIAGAYRAGLGNVGGAFPASHRADEIVARCRAAVADLVGAPDPAGVVLGPNMTTLTYRLAYALARDWGPGDEVVVSRLDHDANVRPWVQVAERRGATVRWAEIDPDTGELPAQQYDDLLTERTRLVAVTAASNVLGTRPDLVAITSRAHRVGALTYVDGVHATAHGPVDMVAWGADFYATSAYKWSGPHVGAVVADPALLERVRPDKLASAADAVPGRFETGTSAFADFAGVVAAVEHLARLAGTHPPAPGAEPIPGLTAPAPDLAAPARTAPDHTTTAPARTAPDHTTTAPARTAPDHTTTAPASTAPDHATTAPASTALGRTTTADPAGSGRRERLVAALSAAEEHERRLFARMWAGLTALPAVTTYGAARNRTATAYFTVAGYSPAEVAAHLAARRVNVWHGHNYAWEVTGVLGLRQHGSAVRAGLVHYNDDSDVERLVAAVAELAG